MSDKFKEIFHQKGQLTGEEVINKLLHCATHKPVYFAVIPYGEHSPTAYPVNDFFSWRGSYSEPSIWSSGDKVYTVDELVSRLRNFFGSVQEGWKGGEFVMYADSFLWCDSESCSQEYGAVDVVSDEDNVYIVVGQCKY